MTPEEIFAETERVMRPYLPILAAWEELMRVWVPAKAEYDRFIATSQPRTVTKRKP